MLNGLTQSYIAPNQYEDVVLLGGKFVQVHVCILKATVFSIGKM